MFTKCNQTTFSLIEFIYYNAILQRTNYPIFFCFGWREGEGGVLFIYYILC